MDENKSKLNLDPLRSDICEAVKAFADKLTAELGDNLQSITVVGSSLTQDYSPGQSDINTVLVLEEQNLESLECLARSVAVLFEIIRK